MMMKKTSFLTMACLAVWISGSHAAQADQLCPDTAKASDLTVGDVADLQYDIDRLALCVQRARLLQQIDETVKKREALRQEPFAGNGPSTGLGGAGIAIPPMPMPSELPALQRAATQAPAQAASPAPTVAISEWKIQRIWGQGAAMQAQLAKGDVIANVKLNDLLPTGERVSELSGRGVSLDNGKMVRSLNWLGNDKKDGKGAVETTS